MMASRDLRVVLRDSAHNNRARAMLRQHRLSISMSQEAFSVELSRELQGRIAMTTLCGYEGGRSGVPASVLFAAAAIAHRVIAVRQREALAAQWGANSYESVTSVTDDHRRSSGYPLARALAEELRELLAKEES